METKELKQAEAPLHDHKDRAHALLSPSSAHRWLVCTPSARMEDAYPDTSGEAALEGTIAHEIAETYADAALGDAPEPDEEALRLQIERYAAENDLDDYDPDEIIACGKAYAANAKALKERMQQETPGYYVGHLTELTLDLSDYLPEGFGSVDLLLYSERILQIADYKYGRGVRVSARENPQMMIYALGALNYYRGLTGRDPEEIRLQIYQPRIDHIDTYAIDPAELIDWSEKVLMPRAATAWRGEGKLTSGEHCRFCRAKLDCAERRKELYDLQDFALGHPDSPALTDEELGQVLRLAESVRDYLRKAEEEAMARIAAGRSVAGWKVVPGRSVRKVADEEALTDRLREKGYSDDQFYERKLLGIGKLEKLVGKKAFASDFGDLLEKPEGKPTLVPDDDPREAKPAFDASDFAVTK